MGLMDIALPGLGIIENQLTGAQEYSRSKNLMGMQYNNQQELNRQGHEIQKNMWDYTNYGNQMAHMKEAGLNPALMYGQGGGGGTTAGGQGGGSAAMGQAPKSKNMGIEGIMTAKQMELMDAQEDKTRAEADRIRGVDTDLATAKANNLDKDTTKKIQETTNLKTVDQINKFERDIRKAEKERTDKGMIKGDNIGNLLNATGLDPVNNPKDRIILNTMLGAWFGSKIAANILGSIRGLRPTKSSGKDKFKQPPLKEVKGEKDKPFNHITWSK